MELPLDLLFNDIILKKKVHVTIQQILFWHFNNNFDIVGLVYNPIYLISFCFVNCKASLLEEPRTTTDCQIQEKHQRY